MAGRRKQWRGSDFRQRQIRRYNNSHRPQALHNGNDANAHFRKPSDYRRHGEHTAPDDRLDYGAVGHRLQDKPRNGVQRENVFGNGISQRRHGALQNDTARKPCGHDSLGRNGEILLYKERLCPHRHKPSAAACGYAARNGLFTAVRQ